MRVELREPEISLRGAGFWMTGTYQILGNRNLPAPHIASAFSWLPAPGSHISFASCRAQSPVGVKTKGLSWAKGTTAHESRLPPALNLGLTSCCTLRCFSGSLRTTCGLSTSS